MIVAHSGQLGSGRIMKSRALLDILVVALGSRHRLTRPSPQKHSLSAVCARHCPTASRRARANPSRARQWTLPLSTTAPVKSDPVTPVTTPSRGASPTFLEGTCTRSPTTAIYRMVPLRGVSGSARSRTFRLQTLLARPLFSWLVRRSPVAALRQPTPPSQCARVRPGVMAGPGVFLPAGHGPAGAGALPCAMLTMPGPASLAANPGTVERFNDRFARDVPPGAQADGARDR